MISLNNNVEELNFYVKLKYEVLKTWGKQCDYIKWNLLKWYKVLHDN